MLFIVLCESKVPVQLDTFSACLPRAELRKDSRERLVFVSFFFYCRIAEKCRGVFERVWGENEWMAVWWKWRGWLLQPCPNRADCTVSASRPALLPTVAVISIAGAHCLTLELRPVWDTEMLNGHFFYLFLFFKYINNITFCRVYMIRQTDWSQYLSCPFSRGLYRFFTGLFLIWTSTKLCNQYWSNVNIMAWAYTYMGFEK